MRTPTCGAVANLAASGGIESKQNCITSICKAAANTAVSGGVGSK
jgi:hypothetical protein